MDEMDQEEERELREEIAIVTEENVARGLITETMAVVVAVALVAEEGEEEGKVAVTEPLMWETNRISQHSEECDSSSIT